MSQNPSIFCYDDADAVARAAADLVVRAGRESIAARGRFTLVLAGGSTPQRTYEILSQPGYSRQIDWSNTDFFWGDERPVPPDHEDSNYRMADRALLGMISLDPKRVHRLQGELIDLDFAAIQYEEEIASAFDASTDTEPPSFDLVLLGMGADGHTASLFPHTEALGESSRWVVANSVPQLATHRLTMTAALLNRARTVVFLVTGAAKAQALAGVLEGPSDPHRLPSQLIQPRAGKLVWLLDREAAGRLRKIPVTRSDSV
jgi:6-phosphogluconolactonase